MTQEKTQITTRLIADEAITRELLNITTPEHAVIAKIVERSNSGIKIADSSGVDAGTGDVQLQIDTDFLCELLVDEQLIGVVNGVNKVFYTSVPYVSGSISIFRNGLKCRAFSEISDTQIELTDAPLNAGFTDLIEATFIRIQSINQPIV